MTTQEATDLLMKVIEVVRGMPTHCPVCGEPVSSVDVGPSQYRDGWMQVSVSHECGERSTVQIGASGDVRPVKSGGCTRAREVAIAATKEAKS